MIYHDIHGRFFNGWAFFNGWKFFNCWKFFNGCKFFNGWRFFNILTLPRPPAPGPRGDHQQKTPF